MINKESDTYKRLNTIFRTGFEGDGRIPNLFEPEKKGINNIMDILEAANHIDDEIVYRIKGELEKVENSIHYDGSKWYDFKLHLFGLLKTSNYSKVKWGKKNRLIFDF